MARENKRSLSAAKEADTLARIKVAFVKSRILNEIDKLLDTSRRECFASAMRFLKETEPSDRIKALALETNAKTIEEIKNIIMEVN